MVGDGDGRELRGEKQTMMIRKMALLAAVVGGLAVSPQAAEAQILPVAAGGLLGGIAGSIYASGLQATMASIGSGVTSTVSSVVGVVPATASAVTGAVATASAPVLVGVVAGGAIAYLVARQSQ